MAKWMKFAKDHDHQWPSGAMTHFEAGAIVYVKDEVVDRALSMKAAEETERPEGATEDDGSPTPTPEEGRRPKRG